MRLRDETKQNLIREKAIELLVNEGFNGFSMQKLAKAANVSPATSYIYYKDKEDLLLQLFVEESERMAEATLKGFDPEMSFSEGLRIQWINRAKYCMKHPQQIDFLEKIKHSPLQGKGTSMMNPVFKERMKQFVMNAIRRNEIVKLPFEVYWSIAFAPLYNLAKFHIEGKDVSGVKFTFTEKNMLLTLDLVLKALRP